MRSREAARLARMEADGTMDARRARLRAWFAAHHGSTEKDAVRELGWAGYEADVMYVTAAGLLIEMRRARAAVSDAIAGTRESG